MPFSTSNAGLRRPGRTPFAGLVPGAIAAVLCAVLLLADRLPRFYQGDSTSYIATGTNGWIPPDRSWAYGFGANWLAVAAHSASALPAMQVLLQLGAILLCVRCFPTDRAGRVAAVAFAALAVIDPLNATYARFWLSDTAAAAGFLGFVALVPTALQPDPQAGAWRRAGPVAGLSLCLVFAVFVRVAYAPIALGTLMIALAVCLCLGRNRRAPGVRRRLLGLLAVPIVAVGLLGSANSVVALPALRGQFFLNRMSSLYTMGVFLPGLRIEDFQQAGIDIGQPEFDRLRLGRYDDREVQMWGDGPQYVRSMLEQKLGISDPYDSRFQAVCAAIVHAAVLHHPQTLLVAYAQSLAMYFSPTEWSRLFDTEMGFGRPLPQWTATFLGGLGHTTVRPDITDQRSLLPSVLARIIGLYPFLLLGASGLAVVVLVRCRRFGAREVVAAALLASLLVTPLFSHVVKPRYVLASVTLSLLLIGLSLVRPAQPEVSAPPV